MSNGGGSYVNLFCAHPPFQIDGNFGGTAGITEMLLQSQNGYIEVLPALPEVWKEGHFTGLHVRGAAVIDAQWQHSRLSTMKIRAAAKGDFKIKLQNSIHKIEIRDHQHSRQMTVPGNQIIHLPLYKGQSVTIRTLS